MASRKAGTRKTRLTLESALRWAPAEFSGAKRAKKSRAGLPSAARYGHQRRQPRQLAVGDGDAVTDAGRAELLAIEQHLHQAGGVEPVGLRHRPAELGQHLGGGGPGELGHHRLGLEEVLDIHPWSTFPTSCAPR
jgi:hypothetical protein